MPDVTLTERMKDFFTRQIACFEAIEKDLETLETDLQDPELEKVLQQQEEHGQQAEALGREFRRLSVEWDSALNLSESDRAAVRVLAHRAGELAEHIAMLQEKGRQLAQGRMASLQGEINEIRRGQELMGKYGHGGTDTGASFIDRKA